MFAELVQAIASPRPPKSTFSLNQVTLGAGSTLTAFHDAYLAGAITCAVGTILAWTLIRTEDARATMVT